MQVSCSLYHSMENSPLAGKNHWFSGDFFLELPCSLEVWETGGMEPPAHIFHQGLQLAPNSIWVEVRGRDASGLERIVMPHCALSILQVEKIVSVELLLFLWVR